MGWLVVVEWASRLVLALLVGLSVWSVAIMVDRRRYFQSLFQAFQNPNADNLPGKLLAEVQRHGSPAAVQLSYDMFLRSERTQWEKGLAVLGTLGSTTPFVGLFGTILGIIVSFGELSGGQGNTNTVMFALAEALILTAVGLLVAIPSVVAFNYFNRQAQAVVARLANLRDQVLLKKGS